MDDRRILDAFPLPLARGFRRWLNAREARERHDAAYYLFEILLKYCAGIAVASYLALEERDHRVNAALKGLSRPSLGEWVRFLRECLRLASKRDRSPATAVAALFSERTERWGEALSLFNEIRDLLQTAPGHKKTLSLEMLFSEVVSYRNKVLAHGAARTSEHYERFGRRFASAFKEIVERWHFLTACRLVAIDSVQVEEGSRVECAVVEYMGSNPVRRPDPLVIEYGDRAPRRGSLHLLGGEADFLCLDPLVIAHDEDVFFLNEAEGSPEYLSYTTGHRYRPADLGDTQRELFRRVLSYDVDAGRVSRMSEDLDPAPEAPAGPAEPEAKRLGDYRIMREVGRGAMGVVYEAMQESLGRRVALKVLPGSFGLDPHRVERFLREARATARIHHPNIVPVYEVGEDSGNRFYAMEFVDGEPLDRQLTRARESSQPGKRGRSSGASDTAAIAAVVEQIAAIAEGLEKAHRLGLVHRDVKPSNIMVDRGGRYVLVDFGLVREVDAETLTRSGEMVGTLVYMSPEQVSRRPVDARSDVYSLGVTLYELLTARAPFAGSSDPEIQNAILFEEPAPPRRSNPRLHRDLETIVLHAMEKNPERRYASAGAFAADLRRFLRYEAIQARPQTAARRVLRRAARHRGKVATTSVILILASATALLAWKASRPPHYALVNQRPLTTDLDSLTTEPAFSRDGKLLAYASDRGGKGNLDIWLEAFPGGAARQLTFHEADDREPDFSPDGTRIAFRSDRGRKGIYLVATAGGEESMIAEHGKRPRFSPDGSRIVYWVGSGEGQGMLYLLSLSGGPPRRLCPENVSAYAPVWLPDGRHILFVGWDQDFSGEHRLWVASADDGRPSRLWGDSDLMPYAWMPERKLLLLSRPANNTGALWAARVRAPSWELRGPPRMLTAPTDYHGWPATAGTDHVAFASLEANRNLYHIALDAGRGVTSGKLERLTASTVFFSNPSLSADGKKLCFAVQVPGGLQARVLDLEGGKKVLWASPAGVYPFVTISPSGSRVAYAERHDQDPQCVVFVADLASGTTRRISDLGWIMNWSPDESCILACRFDDTRRTYISRIDVATGQHSVALQGLDGSVYRPRFSPDGGWIAFNAVPEQTRSQIFIAPFRGMERIEPDEWIPITDGAHWDDKACWSPDGDLLYFTSDRDGWRCIYAQRLDRRTKRPLQEAPIEVLPIHSARLSARNIALQDFDMAMAAGRLVINLGELTGNLWLAEIQEQ